MCSLLVTLMMQAAGTSEILVSFYQTIQHSNQEDSHLHVTAWSAVPDYQDAVLSELQFGSFLFVSPVGADIGQTIEHFTLAMKHLEVFTFTLHAII
jgi:hypothetical protein